MNHLPPRRSSLFLMELLIAILFFSLAAGVCVRLFAQSHQLSEDATQLHMAVIQAQNVEEAVSGCEGNLNDMAALFPNSSVSQHQLLIYYNEIWELCQSEDATYHLALSLEGDTLLEGNIVITSLTDSKVIHQLPVKYKIPATFTLEG